MVSPGGWQEPGQRPEFEEITVVLRGLLQVEHETGVPVRLSELPLETVVLGAGRCLESFDRLREMFMDRPRGSSQRFQ